MKIALLGAASSGKTAYFTALYHRFQNVVGAPIVTATRRAEYRERRVDRHVGFRLRIEDLELETVLKKNARFLTERPITAWPDPTRIIDKTTITVQFDFVPVDEPLDDSDDEASKPRSYQRSVTMYDPSGDSVDLTHNSAASIISELQTCDAAIVFLPATAFSAIPDDAELDDESLVDTIFWTALRTIMDIVVEITRRFERENDCFPICFVVSKFDLIEENKVARVRDAVNVLLTQISKDNPSFMFGICPISVVDPKTGNFRALNLEWPFLFAAVAAIFRNSQELIEDARDDEQHAAAAEATAQELEELRRRSIWRRFRRWFSDGFKTSATHRRVASSYYDSRRRKIELANDDATLARDVLAAVEAEGAGRGFSVIINGVDASRAESA